MSAGIPRRIIQIWGQGAEEMPLACRAAAANISLLNPHFEYLFFDNEQAEEFVDKEFPEYGDLMRAFHYPIQRYDFFRYLAVYHVGGFYLDLDVFLASGLDDLLDFGCVFPFEELTMNASLVRDYGMDWEIGNYAFGASAGHPFLLAIIQNCVRAQKHPEWAERMMRSIPGIFRDDYYIFNTTGPGLVSRTLAEFPDAATLVKVLFPEDVCDPAYWHTFGEFGVHLQSGSWRNRNGFLRRRLCRLWEARERKKLLQMSLERGKNRSLDFKKGAIKRYQC